MKISAKKVLLIAVILFMAVGIIFMCTEVFYSRNEVIEGTLDGREAFKLEKYEKNSHYYVSFEEKNKEKVLECTKEQYDFMTNEKQIYILYKKNYFNRNKGKILIVADVPIANYFRGM